MNAFLFSRTYLFFYFFVLFASSSYPEIVQIDSMQTVYQKLKDCDRDTLILFDVDMVLVQPSNPAFHMANLRKHRSIAREIMGRIPEEELAIFFSLMTIGSPPELIDPSTPKYLKKLENIPMMAFTANLTGSLRHIDSMERWRIDSLKQLGIDFSPSAPIQREIIFNDLPTFRGNYSKYLEGILIVNGKAISKGEALEAFLKKSSLQPKQVIFIDDRLENLTSVESTLDPTISFLGIHFIQAEKTPSQEISAEEFRAEWEKLLME